MRKILLIILIFIKISVYAQGNIGTSVLEPYTSEVNPPAPEPFNMTKYGDISLNEFYGKTALNIPIYNYKVGNLNINLVLSHDGSGVKVDDISNWTGCNWTLETGGIITRNINDLTDEKLGVNRIYIADKSAFISQNVTTDGTSQAANLGSTFEDATKDTEVDMFNYKIPGYSGSFYLNSNFEPILTKFESELEIKIIGNFLNNHEFMITTPDGICYFFGGINACEETKLRHNDLSSGVTTFFITKIKHPVNGEILFEYNNLSGKSLNLSKEHSINLFDRIVYPDFSQYGLLLNPINCDHNLENSFGTLSSSLNQLLIINHKYLNRIYSSESNESIHFNSEGDASNFNIDRILNSIEIKKGASIFKKIDLSYYKQYILGKLQRTFLTKIEINKDLYIQNSSLKHEVYKFEYNEPEKLPQRLSFSQDFIGYYNGSNNNMSLLPNSPPTIDEFDNLPSSVYDDYINNYYASNRLPNFQYATKGILTKIIYPTGGYTLLEYESEPVKKKKFIIYNSDMSGLTVPGINSDGEYIEFEPVYENQIGEIKMFVVSENPSSNHYCIGQIMVTDMTDSSILPETYTQSLGYTNRMRTFNHPFIKNHVYKIEVLPQMNSNCNIEVNFSLRLFNGYEIAENIGIRLKRISTFSSETNQTDIKRFFYSNPKEINKPVEELPNIKIPNHFYEMMINSYFDFNTCTLDILNLFDLFGAGTFFLPILEFQIYYKILKSKSLNNYFSTTNNSQMYPEVTVSYGGDNFENGGIYKSYNLVYNEEPTFILPITQSRYSLESFYNELNIKKNNENITGGDLLKEIKIKKVDNDFYKLKENSTITSYSHVNTVSNLIGRKVYNYSINTVPYNTTISNFIIAMYDVKSFDKKIVNTESKEFFSSLPKIDEDDTLFKKITNTQTKTYGSLKGLPIETKNYSSEGSQLITKNYYPNQISTLSNVTENEITANNKLVSQNRIATPIQVEQYRNGDLLSTQRNVNKSWNNNPELILPEKILSSTGTQPLEERVIFSEYDAKGNPSIFSLKDGSKTKYYYNNINQVILKVENYTTSLNIPDVPNLSDACGFINQYPSAQITVFNYDSITNQITSIVYPNCIKTYYEYDSLHNLKLIKDSNGKIIQEFDHNYKPQN